MKKIILHICLFACTIASAYAQNKNVPFDFKNIKLGTTISEFKTIPIPETSKIGMGENSESFLVCSDDSRASIYSRTDAVEKKFDGINCEFGYTTQYSPKIKPDYRRARVVVGKYTSDDYSFKFINGPKDTEPVLYEILFYIHTNAFPNVTSGLIDKFGKPKIKEEKVQNKLGASFSNLIMTWENSSSVITYEQRYTDLETSRLIYELKSHKKLILNERRMQDKSSM
jgi:hypothetical protein